MAVDRMIVVGLDGATFDLIKPWVAEGKLPTFARLLADGAHAELRSTLPALTPPAWTSAATGKNPGKHNIYDFYAASADGRTKRPFASVDLRGPRVWNIASANGKRAGVVHFPLTYPPEDLAGGFVVSGLMTPMGAEDYTSPPALKAELAAGVPGYRFAPEGAGLRIGDARAFRDEAFELQRVQTAATMYLLDHKEWDVFWVVFPVLDKVQHFFWHFMDPTHPAHRGPSELADTIFEMHELLDHALAEILRRLDDRTGLLVMSDHGACAIEAQLSIATWLEEAGFLTVKAARAASTSQTLGGLGGEAIAFMRALRRSGLGWLPKLVPQRSKPRVAHARGSFVRAERIEWSATRVFSPSALGNGLRVNLRGREAEGIVAPDDFDGVCREVRDALLRLTDPATGREVVKAVHRRDEIYHGPHVDNGADLLVETHRPYGLLEGFADAAILPAGRYDGERTADHARNGIFLLAGAAARQGAAIAELDICDVAPTLLHLLGLPAQSDMDGTVAVAALADEYLDRHPVRTDQLRVTADARDRGASGQDLGAVEGSLEGLGYL